jgi:hypothetical protein
MQQQLVAFQAHQQQQQQQQQQFAQQQQQQLQFAQGGLAWPQAPAAAPLPKVKAPAQWGGERKDVAGVRTWLYATAKYFEISGAFANDAARLAYLPLLLEGTALQWWRSCELAAAHGGAPLPVTWAALEALLLARFEPANAEQLALDQLMDAHQSASVGEYVAMMHRLFDRLPALTEAQRVYHFVKGLKRGVQVHVGLAQPATFLAAVQAAERVEGVLGGRRAAGPAAPALGGPQPMELGALDAEWDGEEEAPVDDEHDLLERLAAVRVQAGRAPPRSVAGRPAAGRPAASRPAAGRPPARLALPAARPPVPFQQRREADAARREHAYAHELCFYCLRPGHTAVACPSKLAGRPKAVAPPV